MVCAIGSGKMTALARLLDAGNVLQTATDEVGNQKLAALYIGRELRDADEANLLDEEDMHIFGFRPMTDPLDLVCCNACKKPIKASQYAAHAELCKSLSSRNEISVELDGPAVNRKPPRKERKKLVIGQSQTKKATSVREPIKFESVYSDDTAAPESHMNEKIQMSPFVEATRNTYLTNHKMNGSRVNPCNVDCSEDVIKRSSKPVKRTAAESVANPGTKNFCKTTAEVPYVPAPMATKIYYSQRNHRLRRAICHMFFEESNKESSSEVSNLEALQAAPTQITSPGNFSHEQVANQQRDNSFLHLARPPDQILAASSDFYVGKAGAFVPSMNTAAQLPVNNTLGPHTSNSYSFADKAGNPLSTLQQGGGSVPVV